MSADWSVVTIDELKSNDKGAIAIGPFGSRMKSDCYVANGIPVIRGTNITGGPSFEGEFVFITQDKADELGSCNVYKDDLVFPHRGSIGEVGIILSDERYVISSSLMKLTCDKNKANPKFLYYFFKSKNGRHELLKNASQVGTPGIGQPLASLKSISLKLPSLETQNIISDVLTSLDKKIHLNTQTNQTLESIAQAIFKSWFVDFEPVKAKMAAKERWYAMQPTSEPASPVCYADEAALPDLETYTNLAAMCAISGKSETELAQLQQQNPDHYQQLAETAALFPSAMVDSELGEIPEGWEVTKIGSILERLSSKTKYSKTEVGVCGQTPVFEQGASIILGYHNDVAEIKASAENPVFIFGDHTCVTHLSCRPFDISANVIPLRGSRYHTAWTYYAIQGKQEFQEYRRHWSELVCKEIVTPSNGALPSRFSETITPSLLLAESLRVENQSLISIRDGLIPKLLSGDISLGVMDDEV